MRVEYVCHACLLIDTGDARIVTDPWFAGPAYCGQWHVFPKPVDLSGLQGADAVILSHGHEDHLHPASLRRMPKSARVFYPYGWYGGTKPYLEKLGFSSVTEAFSGRTYRVSPRTTVTCLANNLDSIVVIENGEHVLVNVNDALHAHPQGVIDMFIAHLRRRWPRIDTVFCGFGGASYFPNMVRCPGKHDEQIGRVREQLFAHSFCRIVSGLRPRVAVPFAADFALLRSNQRWINDIRFPREQLPEYYREHFAAQHAAVAIEPMYPGDVLVDGGLHPHSPYRAQLVDGGFGHLLEEQYAAEIDAVGRESFLEAADAQELALQIRGNVVERARHIAPDHLAELRLAVRVSDVRDCDLPCYHVRFAGGQARVWRSRQPGADCNVIIDTSSRILRHGFAHEWGGDAMVIGYGAEITLTDPAAAEAKLDSTSIQLLTRLPSARRQLRKEPLRTAQFLLTSPLTRAWTLGGLRRGFRRPLNILYDQSLWLRRTKCDICRACDLPLIDAAAAARLEPVQA